MSVAHSIGAPYSAYVRELSRVFPSHQGIAQEVARLDGETMDETATRIRQELQSVGTALVDRNPECLHGCDVFRRMEMHKLVTEVMSAREVECFWDLFGRMFKQSCMMGLATNFMQQMAPESRAKILSTAMKAMQDGTRNPLALAEAMAQDESVMANAVHCIGSGKFNIEEMGRDISMAMHEPGKPPIDLSPITDMMKLSEEEMKERGEQPTAQNMQAEYKQFQQMIKNGGMQAMLSMMTSKGGPISLSAIQNAVAGKGGDTPLMPVAEEEPEESSAEEKPKGKKHHKKRHSKRHHH